MCVYCHLPLITCNRSVSGEKRCFPEMLHLSKAATVEKVNYLTERACGDALLLQHREKLQKNSLFLFGQEEAMHLLPPAGSCTQAHRSVSFRGAAASFHARNVSKMLFSVCLERPYGHAAIIQQRVPKTPQRRVI